MHIMEGMTQGEPLSIVAYVIGVLLPIKFLKVAYPDATQTWYSDNAGAIGTFDNIGLYFNLVKQLGPGRGY